MHNFEHAEHAELWMAEQQEDIVTRHALLDQSSAQRVALPDAPNMLSCITSIDDVESRVCLSFQFLVQCACAEQHP